MSDFKQLQKAFSNHIRDPENVPAPDNIENRRMAIYRELFFNNVEGFISSGFPVLRTLYTEQDWLNLIRKFFIQHHCKSPIFLDISEEFVEFLASGYQPTAIDPPFLIELAHYEWVELVISVKQEKACYKYLVSDELKNTALVLSETAWPLQYQFNVHQISMDNQPQTPPEHPTCLVVYRDDQNAVEFMAVTPPIIHMLAVIQQNPQLGFNDLLETLIQAMPNIEKASLTAIIEDTLIKLSERGIVRAYHPLSLNA